MRESAPAARSESAAASLLQESRQGGGRRGGEPCGRGECGWADRAEYRQYRYWRDRIDIFIRKCSNTRNVERLFFFVELTNSCEKLLNYVTRSLKHMQT